MRWCCNFSFLIWLRFCWVSWYCCICFSWHTAWTPVKPQWRLFKAFGGGRGRIQSNLVRIQLDLSFRVVFSRICGVSSRIWGVSSLIWGVSSRIGGVSSRIDWLGLRVKFQSGRWTFSMVVSKIQLQKIRRGYCVRSMRALGAWRKGQWWHWKGSMGQGQWGHWSGSGVLKKVNEGIGQGQWGYWKGSMEALVRGREGQWGYWKGWALVRVNGGIEQWGLNGGIEKKTMKRALVSVNGGIEKGSKGALVRVNGGIEKGQWRRCGGVRVNVNGRWSGSMGVLNNGGLMGALKKNQWKGHWSGSMGVLKRGQRGRWSRSMGAWRRVRSDRAWVWVRQGCGCGSDRGVAAGQTGGCFTGL